MKLYKSEKNGRRTVSSYSYDAYTFHLDNQKCVTCSKSAAGLLPYSDPSQYIRMRSHLFFRLDDNTSASHASLLSRIFILKLNLSCFNNFYLAASVKSGFHAAS